MSDGKLDPGPVKGVAPGVPQQQAAVKQPNAWGDPNRSIASSIAGGTSTSSAASVLRATANNEVAATLDDVRETAVDPTNQTADALNAMKIGEDNYDAGGGNRQQHSNTNGGWGNRSRSGTLGSAGMQDWTGAAQRPGPKSGYECKVCGKPGGEPDSHWFQLCPKSQMQGAGAVLHANNYHAGGYMHPQYQQQQLHGGASGGGHRGSVDSKSGGNNSQANYTPPKKGYFCKICGKEGGKSDSHWFQQCPNAGMASADGYGMQGQMGPGGANPMLVGHGYGMMYPPAMPHQMYLMPQHFGGPMGMGMGQQAPPMPIPGASPTMMPGSPASFNYGQPMQMMYPPHQIPGMQLPPQVPLEHQQEGVQEQAGKPALTEGAPGEPQQE